MTWLRVVSFVLGGLGMVALTLALLIVIVVFWKMLLFYAGAAL